MGYAPIAPLGLGIGQDARFTYETGIGIRRGKMPRLRGVVVLCIGARCPTYGHWDFVSVEVVLMGGETPPLRDTWLE